MLKYNIRITYYIKLEDKIVKVSFNDLTLEQVYACLNDYALSSIYSLLEAHID